MFTPFRGLAALMVLVFVAVGAARATGPDPWPWMVLYGLAASFTGLALRGRFLVWSSALLAISACVAFVVHLPRAQGQLWTPAARDLLGLALVGGWMAILVLWHRRSDFRRT